MLNLRGHNCLVTGSTQGVGKGLVTSIARAGANVVIHGLEENQDAHDVVTTCRAFGVQAHLVTGDLAHDPPHDTARIADLAWHALGSIDLLVSNAGTNIDVPFLDMDFSRFDRTMRLNVYSHYFMVQWFARRWVPQQIAGRIVLIGSINGRLAEQNHTAYDTSKGAIEMMVKTLCAELAPQGIRVNGLAPGLFVTPLTSPGLSQPNVRSWMELHTPNGSVPGPEVAGEAAVYLLSDAARHVHGHMLLIDGGMSAWQQPPVPSTFKG